MAAGGRLARCAPVRTAIHERKLYAAGSSPGTPHGLERDRAACTPCPATPAGQPHEGQGLRFGRLHLGLRGRGGQRRRGRRARGGGLFRAPGWARHGQQGQGRCAGAAGRCGCWLGGRATEAATHGHVARPGTTGVKLRCRPAQPALCCRNHCPHMPARPAPLPQATRSRTPRLPRACLPCPSCDERWRGRSSRRSSRRRRCAPGPAPQPLVRGPASPGSAVRRVPSSSLPRVMPHLSDG